MENNAQNVWAKYPAALPVGSILAGQYTIQDVLGQGGFGITYLAEDYKLKIKVAIKEFFPESMVMRQSNILKVTAYSGGRLENFQYGIQCFLDEARVLAQFQGNPNIVGVRSYFEENGTAYFVMDYIEGTNFKTYIQEHGGKLDWQEVWNIMSPIMDALSTVHQMGVIHRDVTPDNILIANDHTVKLLDFGAARYSMGDRSQSMDVVLKAGYAPKEQYTRRGKQGPYTDVYSVAACFYAALCGYLPPESLDRMEEDDLVPLNVRGVQISKSAEEAILKGLEVGPADRFQTMEEFKQAILVDDMAAAIMPQPESVRIQEAGTRFEEFGGQSVTESTSTSRKSDKAGEMMQFLKKYRAVLTGVVAVIFLIIIVGWIVGPTGIAMTARKLGRGNNSTVTADVTGDAIEESAEKDSVESGEGQNGFVAVGEPLNGQEKNTQNGGREEEDYCVEYLTVVLDALCRNNTEACIEMGIGTAEEVGDFCENVAESCALALLSESVDISSEEFVMVKECFMEMFSKSQYTVKSAKKQEDGNYEAMVAYTQMQFFEPLKRTYKDYITYMVEDYWQENIENIPSIDQLETVMVQILAGSMEKVLEDVKYTQLVETSITVEISDNGFILEDNLQNVGQFVLELFDLEKSNDIGIDIYDDAGEYFIGVWEKEKVDGCGLYSWTNGNKYVGTWKNGEMEGQGYYSWSEVKDQYLGGFKSGMRNGEGYYLWADDSIYFGEWENNERNGQGVLVRSDGSVYSGDWVNNMQNGQGICTWPDGSSYDGEWKNDMQNGQGIYTWSDGSVYSGDWVNGKRHGYGILTQEDGSVYGGEWNNDEWIG